MAITSTTKQQQQQHQQRSTATTSTTETTTIVMEIYTYQKCDERLNGEEFELTSSSEKKGGGYEYQETPLFAREEWVPLGCKE